MTVISTALIIIGLIILLRNELVYRYRVRYIRSNLSVDKVNEISYDKMMFDLRKWTYNQFFGESK